MNLDLIFEYYDKSRDGRIDYKEFTAMFIEGKSPEQFTQDRNGATSQPTQQK